jgi:hypothetical protein
VPTVPGREITQDPIYGRYFDMRLEREQMMAHARVLGRVQDVAQVTCGLVVRGMDGECRDRAVRAEPAL